MKNIILIILIGLSLGANGQKSFVKKFYKQKSLSKYDLICTKDALYTDSRESEKKGYTINVSNKDTSAFEMLEYVLLDSTTSNSSYESLFEKVKNQILKNSSSRCGGDVGHTFYTTTRNNKDCLIEYSSHWNHIGFSGKKIHESGNERTVDLFKFVLESKQADGLSKKALEYLNDFLDKNTKSQTVFKDDSLSPKSKQYKDMIKYVEENYINLTKGDVWNQLQANKNNLELKVTKNFHSIYFYEIQITLGDKSKELTVRIEPNQPIEYRQITNYSFVKNTKKQKEENFQDLENALFSEFYKNP